MDLLLFLLLFYPHERARSADLRQHVVCACPLGARPAAAPRAAPFMRRAVVGTAPY